MGVADQPETRCDCAHLEEVALGAGLLLGLLRKVVSLSRQTILSSNIS